MKHYQCFLRRHSDGGRVLIMKISYIVIGVFGFLVFISFVIACVGIEIQFGKRIEQKGPKMVIPDWIHQKEVEFVSGKNKLKGYIFWNAKDNKLSEKIIVLVHGYGVTYKDYEIEIEEFVKRKYSVFAYDMLWYEPGKENRRIFTIFARCSKCNKICREYESQYGN